MNEALEFLLARRRVRYTVVVLGMHRSGTSLVAGIVRKLGVHMGEELLPANRSNPTGHHEARDIVRLNNEILRHNGGTWHAPPEPEKIKCSAARFRQKIRHLVLRRNLRYPKWGWKDPRTVLTLELYLPHLTTPRIIVCRRDCEQVARSLSARDGTPLEANRRLCRDYNDRLARVSRRIPQLAVQYEALRDNPYGEVLKLSRFLRVRTNQQELDSCAGMVLDDAGLEAARKDVDDGSR